MIDAGLGRRAAAARFGIAPSAAATWDRVWRDIGSVVPKAQGADARCGRIEALGMAIPVMAEKRPDITRVALVERLEREHGARFAPAAVHRVLRRNGGSMKKGRLTPVGGPSGRRRGARRVVCGLDGSRSRTPGLRPFSAMQASPGRKWVFGGPIHGDGSFVCVRQVPVPSLSDGDVVVIETLGGHAGAAVRETIEAVGSSLRCLPLCSPDFAAIANAFATLKALVRGTVERARDALRAAVGATLDAFAPDACRNRVSAAGCEPERSERWASGVAARVRARDPAALCAAGL